MPLAVLAGEIHSAPGMAVAMQSLWQWLTLSLILSFPPGSLAFLSSWAFSPQAGPVGVALPFSAAASFLPSLASCVQPFSGVCACRSRVKSEQQRCCLSHHLGLASPGNRSAFVPPLHHSTWRERRHREGSGEALPTGAFCD